MILPIILLWLMISPTIGQGDGVPMTCVELQWHNRTSSCHEYKRVLHSCILITL